MAKARTKKAKTSKLSKRIVEDVLQMVERYGVRLAGGKLELGGALTDTRIMSATEVMELRVDVLLDELRGDAPEKCEGGCSAKVTHHDSEGVPLCSKCWKSLTKKPARTKARR